MNLHWTAGRYRLKSTILEVGISDKPPWCANGLYRRSIRIFNENRTRDSPNQIIIMIIWTSLISIASSIQSFHANLSCRQDRLGSSTDIKSISSEPEITLKQILVPNEPEVLLPGIETWDTDQHRNCTLQRWIVARVLTDRQRILY